jgi:hypothetical protein
MTGEDFPLALQIRDALIRAGYDVDIPKPTGRIRNGVSVSGPIDQFDAVGAIETALLKHRVQLIGLTGVLPVGSPIYIWVGPRVIGKLP